VSGIDHIKESPSTWLSWRLWLQLLGRLGHWLLRPLALIPETLIIQSNSFLFWIHRRLDPSNHPRGIAGDDMISRHFLPKMPESVIFPAEGIFAPLQSRPYFGNDASSAYRGPFADPHARQDDHVSTNPAIFFDDNLLSQFGTLHPIAQCWVQWMCCTVKGDIGTDEGPRTDAD
jgi:hypothetical protein